MLFLRKKSSQPIASWKKTEHLNPTYRKVISVDFDNVIHDYSFERDGLHISSVTGPAVPGAMEWLTQVYIDDRVDIAIHSFRSRSLFGRWAMKRWMFQQLILHCQYQLNPNSFFENDPLYEGVYSAIKWPWFKPYAAVYLDDKAQCFTGYWPTVDSLLNFKAWNK